MNEHAFLGFLPNYFQVMIRNFGHVINYSYVNRIEIS